MAWRGRRHPGHGTTGRRWRKLRVVVLERDGYRCRECGKAGALEVDHVVPLHQGGAVWALGNLQALCRGCHIAKTRRENEQRRHDPRREAWRALVQARLDQ